ncbi:MAG TPA: 2-C-methyl-D-erythritol 4-phosphate cytidylyltransferase [Xanthomonadales bacterium]|nr:2-C-methyl-D-erythritol 4-phosphate cytidylyltransferase [Xanthomonadales bacterium]
MLRVHALIPAAGLSVRFGGTTLKQYAHLLGKPVIAHSIDAVRWHPAVIAVTVALAPDDGIYPELIGSHYPAVKTVQGGSSRAQTVLNGLLYIRQQDTECEWVLVHDAARPCLPGEDLEALLKHAPGCRDGAILANPVTDTLKREGASRCIENTVDRSRLWAAQTPQLFRLDPLLSNIQAAISSGTVPTDEAEAMELAGSHPLLVPGSAHNIKITGPQDLVMAEFILLQRGR